MAVIRIEKTKNYTVMSNYHFKEKNMSLKAKGLLSLMLSLPDNWDYSIAGLVSICKENETSIKSALNELKQFGYLEINKIMPSDENGGRISYEYIVHEQPIQKQDIEKQGVENLHVEIQGVENQVQLNTKEQNTKKENTNIINKGKNGTRDKNKLNKELIKDLLDNFSSNEEITKQLWNYYELRNKKTKGGISYEQLKIILDDLVSYSLDDETVMLQEINNAIIGNQNGCYLSIIPDWNKNKTYKQDYRYNFKGTCSTKYSSKPIFDNTSNHEIPKSVKSMNEEEKLEFMNTLAKDENGNFLVF